LTPAKEKNIRLKAEEVLDRCFLSEVNRLQTINYERHMFKKEEPFSEEETKTIN
jgi:peptide deformylase